MIDIDMCPHTTWEEQDQGITACLAALPDACWPAVEEFRYRNSMLSAAAVAQVARLCPQLCMVSLDDDDTAASALAFEGLGAVASTLVALEFKCSTYDDTCDPSDARRMAAALARLSSLDHLNLKWSDETGLAADVLAKALPSLRQLTSLDISFVDTFYPPPQLASWPEALKELSLDSSFAASCVFDIGTAAPQLGGVTQLNTLG